MALDALSNQQFLKLTRPLGNTGNESVAYHQGRTEAPVNPYEGKSLFANIDELESRNAEGTNFFASANPINATESNRGSLWGSGFNLPESTGTGELRPVVDSDELREIAIA